LTLTSLTNDGRPVGIVRSQTKVTEFNLVTYFEALSWLRHYVRSWKVAGLIPSEVIDYFFSPFDLILLVALWP
jgi:hypothetical protein